MRKSVKAALAVSAAGVIGGYAGGYAAAAAVLGGRLLKRLRRPGGEDAAPGAARRPGGPAGA